MIHVLLGVIAVAWVFMAMVVTLHAPSQDQSPWWGLVVLLTGLFGLTVYAIVLASE